MLIYLHLLRWIGASQSNQASNTDPALLSQSLIRSICYPEVNKLFFKAKMYGCEHEGLAISAYEQVMKQKHKFQNSKMWYFHQQRIPLATCHLRLSLFLWLLWGRMCPLCIGNCVFESYVSKTPTCLRKDSAGELLHHEDGKSSRDKSSFWHTAWNARRCHKHQSKDSWWWVHCITGCFIWVTKQFKQQDNICLWIIQCP